MRVENEPDKVIHHDYAPAFFGLVTTRVLDRIIVTGVDAAVQNGLDIPARSMSALILLAAEPMGVSELAERLGVTHAAAIKNTRALLEQKLIERCEDISDARRRPLYLTLQGRACVTDVVEFVKIAQCVYADLFEEVGVDLHEAMLKMEAALKREGFNERFKRLSVEG